jgi:hypothetical protein
MFIRAHGVFAAALLVTACGGGGSYEAAEVSGRTAHAICSKVFSCQDSFPGTRAEFAEAFGSSQSACEMAFADDPDDLAELQASIDEGRILIDSANVNACIAFINGVTCEQIWNDSVDEPAACDMELIPQVADGDECVIDEDCISDFCDSTTMTCSAF